MNILIMLSWCAVMYLPIPTYCAGDTQSLPRCEDMIVNAAPAKKTTDLLSSAYSTHTHPASTIVVLMCENIFSERIIKVWNSLPPSIVSFKSLVSFRNSLKNVSLGIYTKY